MASPVSSVVTSRAIALVIEREAAGGQRRRQQHRRRREVGVDRAAAPALAAVVARLAAVVRPREDRQPRRDAGDLEPRRRPA